MRATCSDERPQCAARAAAVCGPEWRRRRHTERSQWCVRTWGRAPCFWPPCPRRAPAAIVRTPRGLDLRPSAAACCHAARDRTQRIRTPCNQRRSSARPQQCAKQHQQAQGAAATGARGGGCSGSSRKKAATNETPTRQALTQRAAVVARVWARTLLLASLSAPRSSSSRTYSRLPYAAAKCSGVLPFCARPHATKHSATPQRRTKAHTFQCSGAPCCLRKPTGRGSNARRSVERSGSNEPSEPYTAGAAERAARAARRRGRTACNNR